ncbi:MAG: putative selenium-dependent hydroxylase accessory protein YqeC [Clostridiaceae bacterium]|nr:putative selenium-dependent hydroxylase accessory protein YqeC [Clostridiaceae bacterium]
MPDRLFQLQPETSSCYEISFEAYTATLVARADKYMVSPFVISTIGGGGKTTTLFDLFLRYDNKRLVTLTSTTAMFAPLYCEREFARVAENGSIPDALQAVTLGDPPTSSGVWFQHPFENIEGKYKGIDKEVFDAHIRALRMSNDPLFVEKMKNETKSDRVPLFLCEADGSKRKPFKAHAPHEPVIPETTDLTLILFGLSGLGKKCTEDVVHRSDLFANVIGIKEGDVITFDHLVKLLKSGMFLKGIPPTSRVAVIFHQTDTLPEDMRSHPKLRVWAKSVLEVPGIDAVFFRGKDPTKDHKITTYMGLAHDRPSRPLFSSILLAAGTSSRMPGYNKLLLPFGNEAVIVHTLRRIFAGPCRDIVIVTGHDLDAIRDVIKPVIQKDAPPDARITVIYNPRYLEGQGTSVACAATVLDESSMACFCVPGDQPIISPGTMRTLTEKAIRNAILVPCREDGSRASPVLFGKDYYDELAALEGDVGGRQVMKRHPDALQLIKTGGSDLIYEDVDTMERYEYLINALGL